MRIFSRPALVVATIYLSLVAGLLIAASIKFDAESQIYAWAYLTLPWAELTGLIPFGGFVALLLNAATVYAIVALAHAAYRMLFGRSPRIGGE
jgi:hypothetical protein